MPIIPLKHVTINFTQSPNSLCTLYNRFYTLVGNTKQHRVLDLSAWKVVGGNLFGGVNRMDNDLILLWWSRSNQFSVLHFWQLRGLLRFLHLTLCRSLFTIMPFIKKPTHFLPTANNTWKVCHGKRMFAAWAVSSLCANTKGQSSPQMGVSHIYCLLPPQALWDCSTSQPQSPALLMGPTEPPWNKGLCSLHQDLVWTWIGKGNLFIWNGSIK